MKRVILLAALTACTSGELAYRTPRTVVGSGRFLLTIDDDARSIVLTRDGQSLVTLDAAAFQVGTAAADATASWDPSELEGSTAVTYRTPRTWQTAKDPEEATIALDYGDGITAHAVVSAATDTRFTLALVADSTNVVLERVVVHTLASDSFYGLGAGGDHVEQRGAFRAMQANSEADPHAAIPFVVATRGWGLFASSQRVGAVDVAHRDPTAVEMTYAVAPTTGSAPDSLRVDLVAGDTALDAYRAYGAATPTTGPAKMPPIWSFGPWFWRNGATQAQLTADAMAVRSLDLAIAGLGASSSAATAIGAFDLDPARFPDPAGLVTALRAGGFHAGMWSAPYSTAAGAASFFPPKSGPLANVIRAPIDFLNPDAATYWRGIAKQYTSLGFDAFALDGGEDIVASIAGKRTGWLFFSGADERTLHYRYPGLYHRPYVDAATGQDPTQLALVDPRIPALFVRSVRAEEKGSILRLSSVASSFVGLRAATIQNIAASVSGLPFVVADAASADPELLSRWIEASALFPIMSLADAGGVAPWTVAPDVLRTYSRLHLQLLPFFWTYAQHVADAPIVRPTGLVDPAVVTSDELLVGDELLVAPVLVAGQTTRAVTFPSGRWFGWSDGIAYSGSASVAAPIASLPLFVREGAIVPLLRPTIDTIASSATAESFVDHAGPLHAVIAPGPARSFVLYDGASIGRAPDGTLAVQDGSTFKDGFVLDLIATSRPTAVTRNGAVLTTWSWSADRGGTLEVTLPAGAATIAID